MGGLQLIQLASALGAPAIAIANLFQPSQAQTWLFAMSLLFGVYIVTDYVEDNVTV